MSIDEETPSDGGDGKEKGAVGPESGRREFLTKAGVLMSVFAAGGVGASTSAAAQEVGAPGAPPVILTERQVNQLQAVINQTMATNGDLVTALRAQNATLPQGVLDILESLDGNDWAAAARINDRLVGLEQYMAGDTNGYFGM